MRIGLFFFVGMLVLAPVSPLDGSGEAEAQRRTQGKRAKKKARPASAKRPVIKLQETPPTDEPASAQQGAVPQRGPTRLDFDDRLVQGQTNRAGSVYLYDRKELKPEPMVKKRESFRDAIIESVYDPDSNADASAGQAARGDK